jgi:hypothetical protein
MHTLAPPIPPQASPSWRGCAAPLTRWRGGRLHVYVCSIAWHAFCTARYAACWVDSKARGRPLRWGRIGEERWGGRQAWQAALWNTAALAILPPPFLCAQSRQAYGARNFRALGAILQRGLLVNLAFGAAIALAWLR